MQLPTRPARGDGVRVIYFDHNATSPLHPSARQAWLEAVDKFPGNPSSPHRLGSRAEAALGAARDRLAGFLNCRADDLVWTSGATEAFNTIVRHYAATLPSDSGIWLSAIEHPCVLAPARHAFGPRLRLIPVDRGGAVDPAWIEDALQRTRPGFIAVMAANNETGVLQPWRELRDLCRAHGVPFVCDATQWLGRLPAQALGESEFVAASAHKLGGPRGVGFLKCPSVGRLTPLLRGGRQEEGRRAGTENVPGVMAMLAAIETREWQLIANEHETREPWRDHFETGLLERLTGSAIVGAGRPRLWNTVSALMPDTGCPSRWVVKLDKLGFAVSTGSACASGHEEASHVISALGYSPAEAARVLRFSAGWETTEADWDALLTALSQARAELSEQSA